MASQAVSGTPGVSVRVERDMPVRGFSLMALELSGKVVARTLLNVSGSLCWLSSLEVGDGFRRRGYGTALVRDAEAWARDEGCSETGVGVPLDDRACRFWESLGYADGGSCRRSHDGCPEHPAWVRPLY